MVTCSKCGTQVVGDATFCVKCGKRLNPGQPLANAVYCGKCGQPLPSAAGISKSPSANPSGAELAIPQNYAAPMCYLFGWMSGLVMYFVDKRTAVRFHAAQSMIVFGALNIAGFVAGRYSRDAFISSGQQTGAMIAFAAFALICFTALAFWIIFIVKSFEKTAFRLPVVARLADLLAGKAQA